MSAATRLIDWTAQDPFLVGPLRAATAGAGSQFEVPEAHPEEWTILRIRSGPKWPAGLAPLDRLAAVPQPLSDLVSSQCRQSDAILLLRDEDGGEIPICARSTLDRVCWNVDPARWIAAILGENYVQKWNRPLPSRIPLLNYNHVPTAIRAALSPRKALDANRSNELAFPVVPLDDLVESLRSLCMCLACGAPPEGIPIWPDAKRAAVTLTHDLDTAWILEPERREMLADILRSEGELGYRGAWYVTAKQLDRRRHADAIEAIRNAGHEIGPHGWKHDAKLDYLSAAGQRRRMRLAEERLAGLGASGIRTPWYCRSPQLMQVLSEHFDYSSSVPNASAFFSSRSNSGCCTVFPYQVSPGLAELPLTLPPDTAGDPATIYRTLQSVSEGIIERGGVVVITLHPQPHQSGNEAGLRAYADFLRTLHERNGGNLWQATPQEIVARYRRAILGDENLRASP